MNTNKKLSLLLMCMATFTALNAQIKIFPGGNTILGATSTPVTASKLQIAGNLTIAATNTTITSSAHIRGLNTYSGSSNPDYTWYGNDQTGFFHPASNIIGITVGNSEKFRFNGSGQILSSNSTSSASTPDYSWNSDPNTGIYRPAADNIGFVVGGNEKARLNANGHFCVNTTTDNGVLNIYSSGWNAAYFKVDHSADWGGTMSIQCNRDLAMNYIVYKDANTNFYVAGAGWIYSQGNYLGSDMNIKDNVSTIDSAMAKINRIRGVNYKLKKEVQHPETYPTPAKYMGVIAQEIEAVAPEVVKTMHDGTKAVSYEMLVGLLIQAMKEQNAEITQLKTDVNNCCSVKTGINNRTTSNIEISEAEQNNWLAQNKPNPFSKETVIEYNVVQEGKGSILIFDMNGKLLKTIPVRIPGKGSVIISGSDLSAGMYYYTLVVNDTEVDTKKMILTE